MTLEDIEEKINTLSQEVAACHSTVRDRYAALDARLDSGLSISLKSKWTPVICGVYTAALLWAGMALGRWIQP